MAPTATLKPIKCVVWDLDGTVWDGVALERPEGEILEPFPEVLQAMALLEERGIVNSVVSRTDPSVARTVSAHPELAHRLVAPQLSWAGKEEGLRRIASELNLSLDSLALIDDSPFERAGVSAVLPEVVVLSPQEALAGLSLPLFQPSVVTVDARSRVDRYRQEQARKATGRSFGGTRAEFLAWCDIRLRVAAAEAANVDRLTELSLRAHRMSSTGSVWEQDEVARLVESDRWFLRTARVADRFGDSGLVGAAFVERGRCGPESPWRLRLFATSCRVAGRGIERAFLRTVMMLAAREGATRMLAELHDTGANLALRVLFRQLGFRAEENGSGLWLGCDLSPAPLEHPSWLRVCVMGES